MSNDTAQRPDIQAGLEPTVTRIMPELAAEIGLNESIMLLQLAYWIKIGKNYRDGQFWTYQSSQEMRDKAFGYWSVSTINRTAQSLEAKGLINVANYNQKKYDRTKWFALNADGISALQSVSLVMVEETICQNDKRQNQNDKRETQDDKPIPETTTENTTENKDLSADADGKSKFDWNATIDTICDEFKVNKSRAGNILHQLHGTVAESRKHTEYYKHQLDEPLTEPQDIRSFGAWYRHEYPNVSMPLAPEAIATHVYRWRQSKQKQAPQYAPIDPDALASIPTITDAPQTHSERVDLDGIGY